MLEKPLVDLRQFKKIGFHKNGGFHFCLFLIKTRDNEWKDARREIMSEKVMHNNNNKEMNFFMK